MAHSFLFVCSQSYGCSPENQLYNIVKAMLMKIYLYFLFIFISTRKSFLSFSPLSPHHLIQQDKINDYTATFWLDCQKTFVFLNIFILYFLSPFSSQQWTCGNNEDEQSYITMKSAHTFLYDVGPPTQFTEKGIPWIHRVVRTLYNNIYS